MSRISGWWRWAIGLGAHDAPRGRGGEAPLASRAWAPHAAVGDRAGAVDAVGLRRRTQGRAFDSADLRLAVVVAVPCRSPALGSDDAVGCDGARQGAASVRWRADLRADRQ